MIEEILTSEEVEQVVDAIIELYPREKTDLKYETEFELLVAAALTAQTTDLAVNRVTPELFEHFPTPEQMMDAPVDEIHDIIRSSGLANRKAKHLKDMAKMIVEEFASEVPETKEELMQLPGVGSKIANVILTNGFGIPAFAVDAHVKRVSQKLHFVPKDFSVSEIEDMMTEKLPDEKWFPAHQSILEFGRNQCVARPHAHEECLECIRKVLPEDEVAISAYEKMMTELDDIASNE